MEVVDRVTLMRILLVKPDTRSRSPTSEVTSTRSRRDFFITRYSALQFKNVSREIRLLMRQDGVTGLGIHPTFLPLFNAKYEVPSFMMQLPRQTLVRTRMDGLRRIKKDAHAV
jgi:hypothetical protein